MAGRGVDEERRLVVVGLAGQEYGVPITLVQEIIRHSAARPVPGSPSYVEGVINLRGRIIPVVDLRSRFALGGERPSEAKVVIVALDGRTVGMVVDEVVEVLRVGADRCAPPPPGAGRGGYVDAVATLGDRLVVVLDVGSLLGEGALAA